VNIDKYKHQHIDILGGINALRRLSRAGVEGNAQEIATRLVSLSSVVRMHLAVEDRFLYPSVEGLGDRALAEMSRRYRADMADIASSYLEFAARWNTAAQLTANSADFRAEANVALRRVFDRMERENREFYPAIEAVAVTA